MEKGRGGQLNKVAVVKRGRLLYESWGWRKMMNFS